MISTPNLSPESGFKDRASMWIRRPLHWIWSAFKVLVLLLALAWAMLAIHYSNLPWPAARLTLALVFAVFGGYALWVGRAIAWRRAFAATFTLIVIWHTLIPPSNDRPWRPEVAIPPRAVVDGNRVKILNYRHFIYRSRDDFDVRYEKREIDISRLASVDLFISYWALGPVGHTFLSFNFDDGSPPVCISIETRPEKGEGFDPLASMFKQFELIYVVGDERDIVRVRTDHRNEDVFLYRIRAAPETARTLFCIYLDRINTLADHPEWYHLLSNSCTVNIIRYSRAVGGRHRRFEIKHFLNGLIDSYLFYLGIIDTSLSFEELRSRSHINEASIAAGNAENFSTLIRKSLPVPGLQMEYEAPHNPQ